MQEIAELERRITAAMERISRGLAAQAEMAAGAAGDDSQAAAELARLTEALEEERMANAQLNERLRVLNARLEAVAEAPPQAEDTGEMDSLRSRIAAQEAEMAELRRVLAGAGHEIAALRAARAAEAAEIARLTEVLEPLVEEARNA